MLRIKLLTVTSLAVIAPGVGPLIQSSPAHRPSVPEQFQAPDVQSVAMDAAREHSVDPAMVLSVIEAESAFVGDATSPKGAMGFMQVMPDTARELGYDPSIWQENIRAGTVYLGMMLSRYRHHSNGIELALAAYNAGPTAVAKYGGIPPFRETKMYVKRVLERYRSISWAGRRHRREPATVLTD